MKTGLETGQQSNRAFTLIDLVVVVTVCALVLLFLFPRNQGCGAKAGRINCVNNLKQVGISFRVWAADHDGKLPMQASASLGGTVDLVGSGTVSSHFALMSNELGRPKVLWCPDDKQRASPTNFVSLRDANLSYFVCLNASYEGAPEMWLTGDRNITIGFAPVHGTFNIPTNGVAGWTKKLHNKSGNIVLADGSVQQLSNTGLNKDLRAQATSPLRLIVP
jgi:prepilin-type processing-associated H-X9-DG protein